MNYVGLKMQHISWMPWLYAYLCYMDALTIYARWCLPFYSLIRCNCRRLIITRHCGELRCAWRKNCSLWETSGGLVLTASLVAWFSVWLVACLFFLGNGQNELYAASSGRENTWMNPSTSAPTSKDTFSSLKKTENCCTCTASHSMCVPKVSKGFFSCAKKTKKLVSRTYFCRDVDDKFFGIIYNI